MWPKKFHFKARPQTCAQSKDDSVDSEFNISLLQTQSSRQRASEQISHLLQNISKLHETHTHRHADEWVFLHPSSENSKQLIENVEAVLTFPWKSKQTVQFMVQTSHW